ncbi:hypothetical protein ACFQ7F_36115 [Streptomyces sp. NPDC056486]|uniref:hypothetical protein n=1 Tax=Streptomyces sp. NPDC056486 TaxID=3345835 RepID=UPI003696DEA3
MATRETRPQRGAVRIALFAMAFLFLVPLLGLDGLSSAAVASDTAVASVAPHADSRDSGRDRARDGGRGCHEGENTAPRGALPAPERTGSPTFDSAPTSYGPRDDAPAPPTAPPPADATSVDLYRTQVIRT